MKLLVVDDLHPDFQKILAANTNIKIDYQPNISAEKAQQILPNYTALVVRSKLNINQKLIDQCPNLNLIARAGAGIDNIQIELQTDLKNTLRAKNNPELTVLNANEANADAVGEHAIGMLLMLMNKLNIANAQVKNKIWQREQNRGTELKGKTIGIVGFGHNGQATAQKLSGFGVKIWAYDKYKTGFSNAFVEEKSLNDLFEHADIVSIHIPLNSETNHVINEKFIEAFKKPFYLVNISRGKIVKLNALIEGLKSQKILGACLDVLENEQLETLNATENTQFEYLANAQNVVLTPHIAGWTFESYQKISEVLAHKILQLVEKN